MAHELRPEEGEREPWGQPACLVEGVAVRWQPAQEAQGEWRKPPSEDRKDEKGVGRDDTTGGSRVEPHPGGSYHPW